MPSLSAVVVSTAESHLVDLKSARQIGDHSLALSLYHRIVALHELADAGEDHFLPKDLADLEAIESAAKETYRISTNTEKGGDIIEAFHRLYSWCEHNGVEAQYRTAAFNSLNSLCELVSLVVGEEQLNDLCALEHDREGCMRKFGITPSYSS